MTWLGLRLLSRNRLVRASDRVESAVVMLATVVIVVAVACAGALGTMVYSARTEAYAQLAQTRHAIVATAVEDSKTVATPQTMVTTGASLRIWVDDRGDQVGPPPPASRPAMEAITLALTAWLSVVLAVATAVSIVRARTSRLRDAEWDRAISCLVDDDGGYTNRMQ